MRSLLLIVFLIGWFSPSPSKAQTTKNETKKKNFYYTCSMHPFVHSDHPGTCPICHMTLIKKFVESNQGENKLLSPTSVEGRKNIQIDQASFSASGAKFHTVESKDFHFEIRALGKALSSNRFTLQVAEVDLPFIKNSLLIKLKSPSMNFTELSGKITSIDSYLEPMGKTVRVEGIITSQSTLKSESTLLASIEIVKNNVVAIPEDAVLHSSTIDYVFIYDEKHSTLNPTRIATGIVNSGTVEILNGLRPGDVITRGANFLLDSESRMQFSYDQKNN